MVNIQPNNTDDLQGIPLWYNSKLGNQILPRWMKNGEYMLSDLVSKNAKILSQNSFISNHKSNVNMYIRYI